MVLTCLAERVQIWLLVNGSKGTGLLLKKRTSTVLDRDGFADCLRETPLCGHNEERRQKVKEALNG